MKTKILLLLWTILLPAYALGQSDLVKFTTPSAATLKQEIDYPVSHSTGIPDISIPLYTIESGSLRLPLTFRFNIDSYMKGGDPVDIAGLGWSVSTDIQISRTINGMDDLKSPGGYIHNTSIPGERQSPKTDNGTDAFKEYKYKMYASEMDEQPDRFYYRLPGKSGSFFLQRVGTGIEAVQYPENGVKIEYSESTTSFTIYDSDGAKYSFPDDKTECLGVNRTGPRITWKCEKILSANGKDEISFSYIGFQAKKTNRIQKIEIHDQMVVNPNSGFSLYDEFNEPPAGGTFNIGNTDVMLTTNPKYLHYTGALNEQAQVYMYSKYGELIHCRLNNNNRFPTSEPSASQALVMSSLTFRGGKLQFSYTESPFPTDPFFTKLLTGITIYNANNEIVRTINFDRSGGRYSDYNLKGITDGEKSYLFTYQNAGSHIRVSDFWGYIGDSAIPFSRDTQVNSDIFTEPGYNRSATIQQLGNFQPHLGHWSEYSPKITIEYPTKGKTRFEFERNKFINDGAARNCGGFRIKEISYLSENNVLLRKKTYKYGRGENGGGRLRKLLTVDYMKQQHIIYYKQLSNGQIGIVANERLRTLAPFSGSATLFGSGSCIFYDEVAEYESDMGAETGKTVYRYAMGDLFSFSNIPDQYVGKYDYDTSYPESVSYYRYASNNSGSDPYTCVSRIEYQYETYTIPKQVYLGMLSDFNVFRPVAYTPYSGNLAKFIGGNISYMGAFFSVGYMRMKSKKESVWSNDGNVVEKTKTFHYSPHNSNAVIRTESDVDGYSRLVEEILYPQDYGNTAEVRDLINNHIISVPVTHTRKRNGRIIASDKVVYNAFGKPLEFYTAELGSQVNYKLKFTVGYDADYNLPMQVTKDDGTTTCYLWSYNGMYPVAEIQNASQANVASAVQAALGMSVSQLFRHANPGSMNLDALRNHALLKNALVTTYKYKPLVGIVSKTDASGKTTYYDYDGFNRLKEVYYYEGTSKRVVESYTYNYKQ